MTVSYSLDVSKARFCGFTKLLLRWKGSIYKILWKEFVVFCAVYALISIIYRRALNPQQKEIFEQVVLFVDAFTDLIPLSFVLGFYVSLVVGRWWNQYEAIPWPDRVAFTIASYVHGSDERSRTIRRTLGRYLILLQVLTFQVVSAAVKRRFPTTQHLVDAGIMTKEEQSVYEKLSCAYGKFWVPCHWFTALATRTKKEGRIKDSILLDGLFREIFEFRTKCCIMVGYDWISVPLVYTQVVTIATYLYCIALLVGRQYLDPSKGYGKFNVDLYVPLFTLLQFFFYVGWLKVAEQILNPYGEDDDDFELNWCIDRTINVVYLIVDHMQMKHPKVKQDAFWDDVEIRLPQTKGSAIGLKNPQLGSAYRLNFEDPEYIPLEDELEDDSVDNQYKESLRRTGAKRQNSSFIQRVLSSGFRQSLRKKSKKVPVNKTSSRQGCSNPAFSMPDEIENGTASRSSFASNRQSSLRKLVKKDSHSNYSNPTKLKLGKLKSHKLEEERIANGEILRCAEAIQTPASRTLSAPAVPFTTERNDSRDDDYETNSEDGHLAARMQPILEESPRAYTHPSCDLLGGKTSQQMDKVEKLVKEAGEVLQEINKSSASKGNSTVSDIIGYESCCSLNGEIDVSEDKSDDENKDNGVKKKDELFLVNEAKAKVISVDIPEE